MAGGHRFRDRYTDTPGAARGIRLDPAGRLGAADLPERRGYEPEMLGAPDSMWPV
ncbi:hypothetical protein [Streptomyces sp. ISL-94]|uniref:hypothetical protein n=1 Tax=Streptomyces sp. ISL-94 TaxID=2819190 RepID=UPI001BE7CC19|nr:hypothetical protein [Streptomyces sp. ISL-94]MBT2477270.1 hypothetical protein [Streptomyces sp. ISL-94]